MNPDLERWLAVATRGLAAVSREEICGEIAAHYEEARRAHEVGGLSEAAARAAAVQDLGDPDAANRGFRESHLTEREMTHVGHLARPERSFTPPVILLLLFLPLLLALVFSRWALLWYIPGGAAYMVGTLSLQRLAFRRLGPRGAVATLVAICTAAWLFTATVLSGFPFGSGAWWVTTGSAVAALLAWLHLHVGRRLVPLVRKAGRLKGALPLTD